MSNTSVSRKKNRKGSAWSRFGLVWPIPESGFRLEAALEIHQGFTQQLSFGPDGVMSMGSIKDYGYWKVSTEGPWLIEDSDVGVNSRWRMTDPFEHPTLHRRFAEIDDPEAVLEFANRYGSLGRIQRLGKDGQTIAEPVEYWLIQARQMRVFVRLLEIAANGESYSAEHLHNLPTPMMAGFGSLIGRPNESHFDSIMLLQSIRPPSSVYAARLGGLWSQVYPQASTNNFEYVKWARTVVADGINANFRDGVHPAVDPEPGASIYIVPQDLLGALYALLAEELLGPELPLRKCPGCGKWFRTRDQRRMTCSTACKQRHWRLKKAAVNTVNEEH